MATRALFAQPPGQGREVQLQPRQQRQRALVSAQRLASQRQRIVRALGQVHPAPRAGRSPAATSQQRLGQEQCFDTRFAVAQSG